MDPFSAPPSPSASVVLPDAPPKRRVGLWIGVAVVAAVAIGGVAFAVTRGDDKPKYSLTAASDSAPEVHTIAFTMTLDSAGGGMTGDVELDVDNQLMYMNMSLGMGNVAGQMEMIVDLETKTTYINRSFFDALDIPLDTDWISMDAEFFEENGQVFDIEGYGSPLDVASVTDDATKVEDLGFDEVNGLKVKHFRVTFDSADIFATNPALEEQMQSMLDVLGGDFPDEIVYELYVDELNQMRKVSYQMDVGLFELNTDMVVTAINEPLGFSLPAEQDVTDARELL